MFVAKIIEVVTKAPKRFEDALLREITRASKTIHRITSAWVGEHQVVVNNGNVTLYRVDLKVTFVLD